MNALSCTWYHEQLMIPNHAFNFPEILWGVGNFLPLPDGRFAGRSETNRACTHTITCPSPGEWSFRSSEAADVLTVDARCFLAPTWMMTTSQGS